MPDVATDTPGTGLGGTDPILRKILSQGDAMRAQSAQSQDDLKASQERQDAAMNAQAAALAPKRAELKAKLEQTPQAPELKDVNATPPKPGFDPKEMYESLSLITALAALGGALTKQPLTAALNNFSAGVHGMVQGNEQAYQDNLKEFDANIRKAKEENDTIWKKYQAAKDKYGNDIQGLQNELSVIAAETQNPIAVELANQGRIVDLMKLQETQNNNYEKVLEQVSRIKEAAARREETMAHNREIEYFAGRRVDQGDKRLASGGGQSNTRNKIVQAGVKNATERLKELTANFGEAPKTSIMFGQHGEGVFSRGAHAMGQASLSSEQQQIDATYQSIVDEAIPVFTGGLRGSDAFRKFLMGQLPGPGDSDDTAAEKLRLFQANITGTSHVFGNAFQKNPQFQDTKGAVDSSMPAAGGDSGWSIKPLPEGASRG